MNSTWGVKGANSQLFSRLLSRARLKHLQLVVRVAELQSLQKAAAEIGLSQPAATHALAEFESVLGAQLFERHARGMRLSPLGFALLPLIQNVLGLMQGCVNTVTFMQAGASGLVRVGAIGAAVSGWLTRALPPFSAACPDIAIDVLELPGDELLHAISNNRVDLVVCREFGPLPEGQSFTPVVADHLVVVCRPGHPLTRLKQVAEHELRGCTWLIPPLTGLAPREFEELCERLGGEPRTCRVSSRSTVLAKAMLDSSEALAWMPYNLARPFLDDGGMAMLAFPPSPLKPLGFVAPTSLQGVSPAMLCLMDSLKTWHDL